MSNSWDAAQYDSQFSFVSNYGADLVDVLDPQPGERILDVGCGTGRLTAKLAEAGAEATGVDLDSAMLTAAHAAYPHLTFQELSAVDLSPPALGGEFDAAFSNAALHWVNDQRGALTAIRSCLRTQARFVAEMGGVHNVEQILGCLSDALAELGVAHEPVTNYFPTVDVQQTLLEECGFQVQRISWYRRPTPLEGTAADWCEHFRAHVWAQIPEPLRPTAAQRINSLVAERGLAHDDQYWADYCRLRFEASAV